VVRSMSLRNVLVIVFASSCNVGRAIGEDRLLATKDQYDAYRRQVRFRVAPRSLVAHAGDFAHPG
jgi:protein-S-isoprenylcysteine O-methyltransferase Ste14